MSTEKAKSPRYIHRMTDSAFVGRLDMRYDKCPEGGRWDLYTRPCSNGHIELVARRSDAAREYRVVPLTSAIIFAGRGNKFWAAAVRLFDTHAANDNVPSVEIVQAPGRVVYVRAHYRTLPRDLLRAAA